jgi:hypothetical protein
VLSSGVRGGVQREGEGQSRFCCLLFADAQSCSDCLTRCRAVHPCRLLCSCAAFGSFVRLHCLAGPSSFMILLVCMHALRTNGLFSPRLLCLDSSLRRTANRNPLATSAAWCVDSLCSCVRPSCSVSCSWLSHCRVVVVCGLSPKWCCCRCCLRVLLSAFPRGLDSGAFSLPWVILIPSLSRLFFRFSASQRLLLFLCSLVSGWSLFSSACCHISHHHPTPSLPI